MDSRTFKFYYGDPKDPTTWHTQVDQATPIPGEENAYQAENFRFERADGEYFHTTLVWQEYIIKGIATLLRIPVNFQHSKGKNKVGDIPVVFRKNEASGRWFVDVRQEKVFIDETKRESGLGIIRSSISNFEQAINERMGKKIWETVNRYGDTGRQGGPPIECHVVILGYSPQLAAEGKSVDVHTFAKESIELLGAGAFMNALWSLPAEFATEIFLQTRDPLRISR